MPGRALEGACELLPAAYRLLPLPHVDLYDTCGSGSVVITSLFAAQLRDPGDPFAVGALGAWVPVLDLLPQVRRCSQPLLWFPCPRQREACQGRCGRCRWVDSLEVAQQMRRCIASPSYSNATHTCAPNVPWRVPGWLPGRRVGSWTRQEP